jgi:hypothetical protein
VRWWDHWLKGADNGAMEEPALRAWMQDYVRPAPHQRMRPGRWVGEAQWPSPRLPSVRYFPSCDRGLSPVRAEPSRHVQGRSALSGQHAGAWCPYGFPTEFPPDQRAEDGLAVSFTTAPIESRIEALGEPQVSLELQVDRPLALIAVRLCDVAPDGSSLLVARGLLNLTHRHSHVDLEPMPVDRPVTVSLPLDIVGHAFDPGHRIRLAVSSGYWPFAWPSPEPVTLTLITGEATFLELPVREPDGSDAQLRPFGEPESTPPALGHVAHDIHCWAVHKLESEIAETELASLEETTLQSTDTQFGERISRRFACHDQDPLSAWVEHRGEHFLTRGDWRIRIVTRTTMSCTSDAFLITKELDAFEGDARVHGARSNIEVPRDLV